MESNYRYIVTRGWNVSIFYTIEQFWGIAGFGEWVTEVERRKILLNVVKWNITENREPLVHFYNLDIISSFFEKNFFNPFSSITSLTPSILFFCFPLFKTHEKHYIHVLSIPPLLWSLSWAQSSHLPLHYTCPVRIPFLSPMTIHWPHPGPHGTWLFSRLWHGGLFLPTWNT